MEEEIKAKVKVLSQELISQIKDYFQSSAPGGQKIIDIFMDEFSNLSSRSPANDPTNIKNFLPYIRDHITKTWDESLSVSDTGQINIGIGYDTIFGFRENKSALKHRPSPVKWVVYLIRGIGGQYAFVSPEVYMRKHGHPMPSEYNGGFLIGKWLWELEGWGRVVGPFESFKHPASGARPVPFFKNVLKKINMEQLIKEALSFKGIV